MKNLIEAEIKELEELKFEIPDGFYKGTEAYHSATIHWAKEALTRAIIATVERFRKHESTLTQGDGEFWIGYNVHENKMAKIAEEIISELNGEDK